MISKRPLSVGQLRIFQCKKQRNLKNSSPQLKFTGFFITIISNIYNFPQLQIQALTQFWSFLPNNYQDKIKTPNKKLSC